VTPSSEKVTEKNRSDVDKFLSRHEETAQFLINNMKSYGLELGEHLNSGNFKCIRAAEGIRSVFVLARRGNLIAQSHADDVNMILDACRSEPMPLQGFIGAWTSIEPIWKRFRELHPQFSVTFESKEILYRLLLKAGASLRRDVRVRLLKDPDFDAWFEYRTQYIRELGIPDDMSRDQAHESFARLINGKEVWGLFENGELVSQGGLNSRGTEIGQIGGVFTPVHHRQKGYSKALMRHLLLDCREIHGHRKSILFTGEADIAAQKLYESVGYERVGYFALIFGKNS